MPPSCKIIKLWQHARLLCLLAKKNSVDLQVTNLLRESVFGYVLKSLTNACI